MTTKKTTKTTSAKKGARKIVESPAALTKRLGPSRKIVRFQKKGKTTRFAILECGHKRTVQMTKRETLRCRRCRAGAKSTKSVTTKKATLKKAA